MENIGWKITNISTIETGKVAKHRLTHHCPNCIVKVNFVTSTVQIKDQRSDALSDFVYINSFNPRKFIQRVSTEMQEVMRNECVRKIRATKFPFPLYAHDVGQESVPTQNDASNIGALEGHIVGPIIISKYGHT